MGGVTVGSMYEHRFAKERVVEILAEVAVRDYPCYRVYYHGASNLKHVGMTGTISEHYLKRNYRMTYPGYVKPSWEV